MKNKMLDLGQKVLILGLGVEGFSALHFVRESNPNILIGVADKKRMSELKPHIREYIKSDRNIIHHLGPKYLQCLTSYHTIIRSPGIPLRKIPSDVLKKGIKVTSATKIFLDKFSRSTIGVTGSKGKSTTSAMIKAVLESAGYNVYLIGNIGASALDYYNKYNSDDNVWFVYELSSYQLEDLIKSPYISAFVSLFHEHLDYHGSFEQYFIAKANICRHTEEGIFIYNSKYNQLVTLAQSFKGRKMPYNKFGSVTIENNYFVSKINQDRVEKLFPTSTVRLLGSHNLENVMAVICVAKLLNIQTEVIKNSILHFRGLEHRLEFVRSFGGCEYYDDAISTAPESTIEAIKIFKDRLGAIILGGTDRGYDFGELAKYLVNTPVEAVILFPESGKRIWKEIVRVFNKRKRVLPSKITTRNMATAVQFAKDNMSNGEVCLLSTASPSYSIFKNFKDKGNQFKKFVNMLYKLPELNERHALYKLGRQEEAFIRCGKTLISYDKDLKRFPRDPLIWYHKACVLFASGKFREALECAEEALRLESYFTEASQLKQDILQQIRR